jgi:hypothetical protein
MRSKKDWVEDDSMTSEEVREKFESLNPAKTVGPELAEMRKERDRLMAGLFMLHQKYEHDNVNGLFEEQKDLLDNLRGDILMIVGGDLDLSSWASQKALEEWGKTRWENLLLQEDKDKWQNVVLIGGPADKFEFSLREAPKRLLVGDTVYERIDDPDTGDFLGGYAVQNG